MKMRLLLAGSVLMLASVAMAAPDKGKPKKVATPAEIHCAVMTGRTVNVAEATKNKMYADYKGNRYFFCCGGCPSAFKNHPDQFAKNAHIPTPKPAKK